ncbi:hypothetical protein EAF04_009067 [Stromatinia cepivora]|nr:hypothetical protein EAF04_009067 [Stromatinia cepivora]
MPTSSLAAPPPDIPGPSSASSHSRSHSASASTSTHSHAPSNPSTSSHPSLPSSPETARQIAEARTALNASIQNIFTPHEHALKLRAQNLHQNSSALTKQENELKKEIGKLGKEGDKLEKVVREGQKRVKELGNVQNWAEVLERDFLVVGEVLRLVQGSEDESEGWSDDGCEGVYGWSGDEGDGDGDQDGDQDGGVRLNGSDGGVQVCTDTHMSDASANEDTSIHDTNGIHPNGNGKGKGKEREGERERESADHMKVMDTEESSTSTNISRSEPSSSSIHTSVSGAS